MTFGLKGLQTKNMKRLICILMLIVISISFSSSPVCAETGKEHQKDFESILFGSDKLEKKEKQISKIFAAAAYLTIDQFKTYGQNYLDTLEKNGVRNLLHFAGYSGLRCVSQRSRCEHPTVGRRTRHRPLDGCFYSLFFDSIITV